MVGVVAAAAAAAAADSNSVLKTRTALHPAAVVTAARCWLRTDPRLAADQVVIQTTHHPAAVDQTDPRTALHPAVADQYPTVLRKVHHSVESPFAASSSAIRTTLLQVLRLA